MKTTRKKLAEAQREIEYLRAAVERRGKWVQTLEERVTELTEGFDMFARQVGVRENYDADLAWIESDVFFGNRTLRTEKRFPDVLLADLEIIARAEDAEAARRRIDPPEETP